MDKKPKSKPEVKPEPRIKVVEDTKGNTGALTVKFLSEINYQLKRIADSLEQKGK